MPTVGACWALSTVGTKSRNSLLNRPGEGAKQVFFQDIKNQFQEKYLSKEVVFVAFASQSKENRWFFSSIPTFGSYRAQSPITTCPSAALTLVVCAGQV